MTLLKLYLPMLLCYLLLDALWLGYLGASTYVSEFGDLLRRDESGTQLYWPAVAVVYFLIMLGLALFVVPKADGDIIWGMIYGAVFGLIAYGVYDFTNYATIQSWSLKISIIDMCWGMFVCGVSTAFGLYIQSIFSNG